MGQSAAPSARTWDLKGLVAWQVATDFATAVNEATREFPNEERHGLRLQLRRAAVSVPSNIAEGHGRGTPMDFARFVRIARGSLKECETQILLAQRFGYIPAPQANYLLAIAERINRLLTGLLHRLRM